MCQRVSCRVCGKATFAGCGQHVEEVLAGVPADQRCACPPNASQAASAASAPSGWGKLFRRR